MEFPSQERLDVHLSTVDHQVPRWVWAIYRSFPLFGVGLVAYPHY